MIPDLVAGLEPAPYAAPWWAALRDHRLSVQRCQACGHRQHNPRPLCIVCAGTDLGFEPIDGTGTLLTHTTIRRAPLPELREHVPYSLGLVELSHGIRMFGALTAEHPDALRIGAAVDTGFVDVTDAVTLLRFTAANK
jgi:uncharacterized protein